jgi:hypothetical protein
MAVSCEDVNEHSDVIKTGEGDFLDMLKDYELLKNDRVPCS